MAESNELDRDDAARLHAEYHAPLLRFCLGYLQRVEDAEDAVQDVLLKVHRSRETPANFRAWLYRVARNHCLNLRRGRGRRRDAAALSNAAAAAKTLAGQLTQMVRAERRSRLGRLVAELPEAAREVLHLRYVEGLSRAEIAEVLELPESVVKSRLYEAVQRLREHSSLRE